MNSLSFMDLKKLNERTGVSQGLSFEVNAYKLHDSSIIKITQDILILEHSCGFLRISNDMVKDIRMIQPNIIKMKLQDK